MCDTCQAASSVMSAQQNAWQFQVQIAVANQQQSAMKSQGQALIELILSAAQVGKSLEAGQQLDVQG